MSFTPRSDEAPIEEEVESAQERLVAEKFDLLLVDQQMRRDGRTDREAGTTLVGRLKNGELGSTNINIPFAFFTGTEEWVTNADVEVETRQGFIGIQEKAGRNVKRWFETQIASGAGRSCSVTPTAGQEGSAPTTEPDPEPAAAAPAESWTGVVIDVDDTTFTARLDDDSAEHGEHLIQAPLTILSDVALAEMRVASRLTWRLWVQDDQLRRRSTSEVEVQAPEAITDDDFEQARARARARREARRQS